MNKFIVTFFVVIFLSNSSSAENQASPIDKLFHIGKMNSHDKKFSLYFKTREKAVLARGEDYNYVTEFPQDLYIYNYKTKISSPLISYEWFPSQAKYLLDSYDYPVFPEDFAYYLLIDNKQSLLEKLDSHNLLRSVLPVKETIHRKLMVMKFLFCNYKYINPEENL